MISVIKVGGNELDDPAFLAGLVAELVAFAEAPVLVHGGGKEISAALEHYGQPVQFIDGMRVTPPESMDIMEMVVCGRVNRRLVAHLVQAGRQAIGMSGVDLGLLRCEPLRIAEGDLGRVGLVTQVGVERLHALLAPGWLPVIAPVALGEHDGLTYNVNADMVALAIAGALAANAAVELVFVSNVPGVLMAEQPIADLPAHTIEAYIQSGAISGGMIPKVRSARAALEQGVAAVRITNLAGLRTGGTRMYQE
jgi:acetylglutamate kinase